MSQRFGDEEVKRILSEAARLAVERAEPSEPGLSYDDILAAAAESGIEQQILDEAIGRAGARALFVRGEKGGAHLRRVSWKPGEPGRWTKYACLIPDCAVRERCPIARWEHVVTECAEVFFARPTLGQVSPATPEAPASPLAAPSPSGRYVLFSASLPGAALREIFARLASSYGTRCAHALGIVDLTKKKAGLLLASPSPIAPVWTGPSTFRVELSADLFTLSERGQSARLLAKLPSTRSQIFIDLKQDPAQRSITRVDTYQLEG